MWTQAQEWNLGASKGLPEQGVWNRAQNEQAGGKAQQGTRRNLASRPKARCPLSLRSLNSVRSALSSHFTDEKTEGHVTGVCSSAAESLLSCARHSPG